MKYRRYGIFPGMWLAGFAVLLSFACSKENGKGPEAGTPGKDSGYVVVYTVTGMTDSINISTPNNVLGKIKPGLADKAGTPAYGASWALSFKYPVGDIVINAASTNNTNRSAQATVKKNDTIYIALNYAYVDAEKDNYFIEYDLVRTENNVRYPATHERIKLDPLKSRWRFSLNTPNYPNTQSCSAPNPALFYDGIRLIPDIITVPSTSKTFIWKRGNMQALPAVATYRNAQGFSYDPVIALGHTGDCDININDFGMTCHTVYNGSLSSIWITNVTVVENLGLEKRGYYEGGFQAHLYKFTLGVAKPVEIDVTGRFKAPMGGHD